MQSAYCCWHRLTACLEQCSTFPCCCFPGFDSVGPTSPPHPRDFDPCFEPLVDDSGSESEQDEPTTGPVASPRGGNPAGDSVKFTAAAVAVHPQAAVLESAAPATATAPKKSSPIRTKLPLLADSPKKIKFGPPKKPPRHFDFVALAATDGGGSAPPEQSVSSTPVPDRKTASAAAAASSSGGSRKLSPRQLFDKLRGGGGGGDPPDERRLVNSGVCGDKVVKQPAADSKAPRKVCYDNEGDDLCSDDESRSKNHALKNTGECRSVTGSSSGQLENIYVGLGGNKSSAATMEPEGIYAEVGWPKIAYYFMNL
jgi:hypothetical protein